MAVFGPLWVGPIKDDEFIESMLRANRPEFGVGSRALGIIEDLSEELEVFSYFDLHSLTKRLGIPAPRTADVISRLRDKGFSAGPTHVTGTGVKTDAGVEELRRTIKELS